MELYYKTLDQYRLEHSKGSIILKMDCLFNSVRKVQSLLQFTKKLYPNCTYQNQIFNQNLSDYYIKFQLYRHQRPNKPFKNLNYAYQTKFHFKLHSQFNSMRLTQEYRIKEGIEYLRKRESTPMREIHRETRG